MPFRIEKKALQRSLNPLDRDVESKDPRNRRIGAFSALRLGLVGSSAAVGTTVARRSFRDVSGPKLVAWRIPTVSGYGEGVGRKSRALPRTRCRQKSNERVLDQAF